MSARLSKDCMQKGSEPLYFLPQRHLFRLQGSCAQLRDTCQSMCCRQWDIALHTEEYRSGLYKAETYCTLTKKECVHPKGTCVQRGFRLRKKNDGSCEYLTAENICTIYAHRPLVCRNFSCESGWRLIPAGRENWGADAFTDTADAVTYTEKAGWDMKLTRNPLIVVEKSSYNTKEKHLELSIRPRRSCHKRVLVIEMRNPMTAIQLDSIIRCFNGRMALRDIHERFQSKNNISYPKKAFLSFVMFLLDSDVLTASHKNA